MNRLLGRLAFFEFVLDDEGCNLGIGLRRKHIAFGGEFLPQRAKILDDAVVDDRKPRGSVRMGVGFGRLAMRRPSRVADADRPAKRRGRKLRLQVLEFALGAPPRELAVLERRHAGGIVAAIFEPLQRIDNRAGDRSGPENPDNSTHLKVLVRIDAAAPSLRPTIGAVANQVRRRNVKGRPRQRPITWPKIGAGRRLERPGNATR